MNGIRITGLSLSDEQPKDNWKVLAYFDCEVGGIGLTGCGLVICKGKIIVTAPRAKSVNGRHAARFVDFAIRDEVKDAALTAFHALGGKLEQTSEAA